MVIIILIIINQLYKRWKEFLYIIDIDSYKNKYWNTFKDKNINILNDLNIYYDVYLDKDLLESYILMWLDRIMGSVKGLKDDVKSLDVYNNLDINEFWTYIRDDKYKKIDKEIKLYEKDILFDFYKGEV